MILYELLHGFLLEMRKIQYLWMAGSWATKMLHPASLGVTKKRPGAIPGVYNGALGSSWIFRIGNYILVFLLTMKRTFWLR